jgi:4-hydroxybenzoate polyprenyltransferase
VIAVGGRGGWEPWLLGLAIGTWVGGRRPLRLPGSRVRSRQRQEIDPGAIRGRALAHDLARDARDRCDLSAGPCLVTPLSAVYYAGVGLVALLLVYEQSLVRVDDLSQVKRAFDLNGYVGILYLVVLAVSIYVP